MSRVIIKELSDNPDYGVSRDGRVWRLTRHSRGKRSREPLPYALSPCWINGNQVVAFGSKQSKRTVARLVASIWIRPPAGYERIRYKDGDRSNTAASNLAWSPSAPSRKISPKQDSEANEV